MIGDIMAGIHLIIDGFKPREGVHDKNFLQGLLDKIPDMLNMKKLCSPQLFDGVDYNPGVTGFVVIEKSHVSVHTFSNEDYVAIDIYSCGSFDTGKIIEFVKDEFGFEKMETKIVKRGGDPIE